MERVALTTRMMQSEYGEWRDAVAQDWSTYLHAQDLSLVSVPNDPENCVQYLDDVRALIITGGDDIILLSPEDESDDPRARRDRTEYILLKEALEREIPVFGVCRGIQLINLAFGGPLCPVEESQTEHSTQNHVAVHHPVEIVDEETKELFQRENLIVNSFHSTALKDIGEELIATVKSPDGLIEGIRHESKKLSAVIWHPERAFEDDDTRKAHMALIRRFID